MKLVDFVIPASLDDARQSLCERGDEGIAAAGCTAFHFYTKKNEKKAVLLSNIGLNYINATDGSFRIGATTPLNALLNNSTPGWVLDRVARHVASHQIRNVSTIGGNIARVFPWADLPVALLALGGSVTIKGESPRSLSVDVYFKSQPALLFQCGDLLTEIEVPAIKPGTGFGHIKQRMKSEAFSLATASAKLTLNDNTIDDARIAIGASVAFPTRLTVLEDALKNQPIGSTEQILAGTIDQAFSATTFLKKEGMTSEYIRTLTATSVTDAVMAALKEAQGGAK